MDFLIYYGLAFVSIIITLGAQIYVSSSYSRYSKVPSSRGITGAQAARYMLDSNGLRNVSVVPVAGTLTDHYDPKTKQVRLSQKNFTEASVAAVAVACHECGHAMQDQEQYAFMRFRSALVPVTRISTYVGYIAILIGCLVFEPLIYVGIIAEVVILLFQLVTLPVETDASRRALQQIEGSNLLVEGEVKSGKVVLRAAAMTYVASVITSLIQVLRLLAIFRRRD